MPAVVRRKSVKGLLFLFAFYKEIIKEEYLVNLNRRQFLQLSGSALTVMATGLGMDLGAAKAAGRNWKLQDTKEVPAICHFCAGGCGLITHVRNGEVVNVEGDIDHPTNQGTLCPKGAALGQVRYNPRRITKPMIRKPGSAKWEEISWEAAIEKVAKKVKETRDATWNEKANRTDAFGVFGSAEIDNEECYLVTKFARVMGTVYLEHQARMCHAPSVTGLAPAFGRGAMTNSWTDMRNAKCFFMGGSNAAENHPIAMRYVMDAKEKGAKVIVADPRFTRTASKADIFAQFRPGTDIAYLGGIINYLLENKLYDHDYLVNFTNALCKVNPEYGFEDGLFSGYDKEKKTYNTDTWTYVLDGQGQPVKAVNLEEPDTVFSHLKKHFSRYPMEKVTAVSGIPADKIKLIADTMYANRPVSILYAMGMTQHTTASQGIRCYTIIQLLLGCIGKAGGAVNALRGEPNVQGSSDMAELTHILPGYIPAPIEADKDLAAYAKRVGTAQHKNLVSLLKAWFGDSATAANDYGYQFLPRMQAGKNTSMVPMLEEMAQGKLKMAFSIGTDLPVSMANNQIVAAAFANIDMLVVIDLWDNETSSFWRAPDVKSESINTEVVFLPAAFWCEKAGSLSNSGRWIQWKDAAVAPEGETKPDLDIIDLIFKKVRELYKGSAATKDQGILNTVWNYDHGHEADPEKVLMEINGYNLAEGRLLKNIGEYLAAPIGTVSSGCWIYSGVFGDGNLSKRRDNSDPSGLGLYSKWTYSWPGNVRVLYNRASCDANGNPLDETRKLVWWDSLKQEWAGHDVADVVSKIKGPDTPEGKIAFKMNAESMGRLFAPKFATPVRGSSICVDGPLPEHYEPIESPTENALSSVQNSPLSIKRQTLQNIQKYGTVDQYPYVLTTNRNGVEHFCSGAVTRNLPWLAEVMPEPFLEIGAALASKLSIKNNELVEVSSARGAVKLKAMVTERIQPLLINGKETHVVNAPYGWGFMGLATGPSINALTVCAIDTTGGTPEYKACLCNVRKVK